MQFSRKDKNYQNITDVVICIEGICLIIEKINNDILQEVFKKLNQEKIFILNVTPNDENENIAKDEITNFINNFSEIKKNCFVKSTINSMIGYLIRRYYYPKECFENQSFFIFNDLNKQMEEQNKEKLGNFLFSENNLSFQEAYMEITNIINEISCQQIKDENCINIKFKKDDFIELRNIYTNGNNSFILVIHTQSLHVFVMKKINLNGNYPKHEINFCTNYYNRVFTRFYGMIKTEKEIDLIYEFLSNGTLEYNINLHDEIKNEVYSLLTIIRIYQGIKYLHSKSLIHRDFKPQNILLSNDLIPFVADFDAIRQPYDPNIPGSEEMTADIVSQYYSSPEQAICKDISFPTDIYSFGLIIYFLNQYENMRTNALATEKDEIKPMKNVSENMQVLYQSCVKYNPKERISTNDVEKKLINEVNSFTYFEHILFDNNNAINKSQIIQFVYEGFLLQINDPENIQKYIKNVLNFYSFYNMKKNGKYSELFGILGEMFSFENNIMKAIKYFELSIKYNNPGSMNALGIIYLFGNGVNPDYFKAKGYFELATKQNDPYGFLNLGYIYYHGYGVNQDLSKAESYFKIAANYNITSAFYNLGLLYGKKEFFIKAKKYFELAANQNDSMAQNQLGLMYENGIGVAKNLTKAVYFYQLAAQQLNSESLNQLGLLYAEGYGVKQDYLKAKECFELSSEQNNADAQLNLGKIYYYGIGTKQDYSNALHFFNLAAQQKNSEALYILGIMNLNGYGVEYNINKAIFFFEASSQLNNASAMNALGIVYLNGNGVKQDIKKAIEYFEISSKNGCSLALNNLGVLYSEGKVFQKNYITAKKYFELAASMNNPNAMLNLGYLFLDGNGVQKNFETAKYYFELASQQNNPEAFNNLGIMFFNGYGCKQSYLKSKEYFEKASQLKYPTAICNLGFLYYSGLGVKRDFKKAKEYFEKASKFNSSAAFFNLGNIYFWGSGVTKDYQKAKKNYEIAASLKYSNALINLGQILFKWIWCQTRL